MDLHYNVRLNSVCKDGEIRFVEPIEVPESWAVAIHWNDGAIGGIIEGGAQQKEFFKDPKRIQPILKAFDDAAPTVSIVEPLFVMSDPGDNKTQPEEVDESGTDPA